MDCCYCDAKGQPVDVTERTTRPTDSLMYPTPSRTLTLLSTIICLGPHDFEFEHIFMNICSCKKCSGYSVEDPMTGILTQGRIVGKKEILAHHRLEKIKEHLGDAAGNNVSSQLPVVSHSPIHPILSNRERESGLFLLSMPNVIAHNLRSQS
jgi:hypothetical protein